MLLGAARQPPRQRSGTRTSRVRARNTARRAAPNPSCAGLAPDAKRATSTCPTSRGVGRSVLPCRCSTKLGHARVRRTTLGRMRQHRISERGPPVGRVRGSSPLGAHQGGGVDVHAQAVAAVGEKPGYIPWGQGRGFGGIPFHTPSNPALTPGVTLEVPKPSPAKSWVDWAVFPHPLPVCWPSKGDSLLGNQF